MGHQFPVILWPRLNFTLQLFCAVSVADHLQLLTKSWCLQDEDVDWQMDMYAACNFQWFLKSGNLVLDFGQVADAVQVGITHVRGTHDRMIDYVQKSYETDPTAAAV